LTFPSVTGCGLAWNSEGGAFGVYDGPDETLDGTTFFYGLEVEFDQEFRPTGTSTDVELEVQLWLNDADYFAVMFRYSVSGSLSYVRARAVFGSAFDVTETVSISDGKQAHTLRLELGQGPSFPSKLVYDGTTVAEDLGFAFDAMEAVSFASPSTTPRFVVLHKNFNSMGGGGAMAVRTIRTTA
jgi:hypothetical protein